MNREGDALYGFVATVLMCLGMLWIGSFVYDLVASGPAPTPVSGRVIEKLEASTGHDSTVYILKVKREQEQYIHLVVEARVWHSVLHNVEYKFETGGKNGYDSAVVVKD